MIFQCIFYIPQLKTNNDLMMLLYGFGGTNSKHPPDTLDYSKLAKTWHQVKISWPMILKHTHKQKWPWLDYCGKISSNKHTRIYIPCNINYFTWQQVLLHTIFMVCVKISMNCFEQEEPKGRPFTKLQKFNLSVIMKLSSFLITIISNDYLNITRANKYSIPFILDFTKFFYYVWNIGQWSDIGCTTPDWRKYW